MTVLLAACILSTGMAMIMLASQKQNIKENDLTYSCFLEAIGWGYDIKAGNNTIIHQTCIPGIPGNKGFSTKQQAARVAQIVIEKIKSGCDPVITADLLQQSGIIIAQ